MLLDDRQTAADSPPAAAAPVPVKRYYHQLYFWVLIGMAVGILIGYLLPDRSPLRFTFRGEAHTFAGTDLKPISDAFIRLIRMMIAPIIFTTVVVGIAGMGNLRRLGRIGLKCFVYFEAMTTLALLIGWVVAQVFKPGAGMNINAHDLDVKDIQQTLAIAQQHHGIVDFLLSIIPDSFVGAFAKGDILQALFVSVLFGLAMASLGEANRPVILGLEQIARALMRMIGMIIKVAPFAVCAAMSYTVSKLGLASLKYQVKIMGCVYGTCLMFVLICLGLLLRYNGISIFKFLRYIREELLIVFGTASSEPVLPRMMVKLENLGCPKSLVGLVLPSGYTFNLDGTSVYLTMGALFIAQATNTSLTLGQEFAVIIVCLATSKGAATVVGSAFITLTATLSTMKTIPVEGMVLVLAVDWLMAQARSMTNMVGNGVATIIIAKWEDCFDAERAKAVLDGKVEEIADSKL